VKEIDDIWGTIAKKIQLADCPVIYSLPSDISSEIKNYWGA